MPFIYNTIMYIDIFTWTFKRSCFCVLSSFHTDCIVTCFKYTVIYMYTITRFNIYAITILCMIWIIYMYSLYCKVSAEKWVDIPCWRVHKSCIFKKYFITVFKTYHYWSIKIIVIFSLFKCVSFTLLDILFISCKC